MIDRVGLAPLTGPFADDYALIKAAEAAGFESAWTNDGISVNGYVRLAAYAAQTTTLKLGTGAVIQPLRNVAVHASAIRDLAEISGNRCVIGLGSGVIRQLNSAYGIFGDQAEHPAPRMKEFVTLLKQLTDPAEGNSRVKWEGRFFNLATGRSNTRVERTPLYIAAVNKHMLNVTAEVADGIIGHPIYSYEYIRDVVNPTINAGLAKAGRDRKSFDFSTYVLTSINEDREIAKRDVAISLGFYLSPRAFDCIFDASGWEEEKVTVRQAFRTGNLENLATAVTERMLDSCCLYGTSIEEVREKAQRFEGLVDQLVLYSPAHLIPKERQYANFYRIIDGFKR